MLNEVKTTITSFGCIPKRLMDVYSSYIAMLMVKMKDHTFRAAAQMSGLHESRFCAMLNDPRSIELSKKVFNRAKRRRLKRIKGVNGRLVIIIDATIVGRKGKKVENSKNYHNGSGFSKGHKMINFVVLDGVQIVPLDSIPIFTKKYCREQGKKYRSENKIVEEWIKDLPTTGLFTDKQIHSSIFLLDSGYDVKAVQKGIIGIGADFVMSLKSNRVVSGKQIQILFRANRRWLPAKLIRLTAGSGGKGSRRTFSVRTAAEVHLKGVGLITAVCSKGLSRSKKPKKYLGTSCLEMSTRQIVQWYSMRWRIETWHREVKQNFGFGDCRSSRFVAIESHITFSLTAYIIQKNRDTRQRSVEEVTLINELKKIRTASTKFGSVYHLKSLINSALQGHAA